MKAYLDGAALAPHAAAVSLFDPGFLYGQAVFETLRAYGPSPVALDAHLDRLEASAAQVGLIWPHPQALRDHLAQTVARALEGATGTDQHLLRLGLFPGVQDPSRTGLGWRYPARAWVTCSTAPPAAEPGSPRAVRAVRQDQRRHPLPTAKAQAYLAAWSALDDARRAGADDAIWTWDGRVTEGPTASVLAWVDGSWWSPAPEGRALDGITRRLLIEALQEAGQSVRTEPLPAERLAEAEEILLVASIREVEAVIELDGRPVGVGGEQPGPRSCTAHRLYRDRVTPR